MSLGAFRLKKAVPVAIVLILASVSFLSCGYKNSAYKPPSGIFERVAVSQRVSTGFVIGGLIILDAENDTLPTHSGEIQAGGSPGLMALSANRASLLTFDSSNNSVQVVNATTEQNTGSISLPGPTTSLAVPGTTGVAYAAVSNTTINGYDPGAVEVLNLNNPSITMAISVPKAQTVISNAGGTQLLVFSNDSDSVSVVSPGVAVGPVDTSCDSALNTANLSNSVCTIVPGFDRPVFAIYGSGSVAYILNCGAECGGTQSSVAVLDLSATPVPTITKTIPVNGATMALLSGTTLYVAGSPPGVTCTPANYPNAIPCGTLDIVDLNSQTDTNFASPITITDGQHTRMDMSLNNQLFVGALKCTNLGDVNNPQGVVRGCLSILNTTNGSVVFPPDNGDVTGLQSFTTRDVEYVVEGTVLRIYDTTQDALQVNQFNLSGQFIDVKALDFF
jgi:hypothetical protein